MFLSLLSFSLPSGHGERITLVMSLLVAFTVCMLIASSFLPETSAGAPYLIIFYLLIFCTMSFCFCATCFTIRYPNITWTEFKAKFCCRCCSNQKKEGRRSEGELGKTVGTSEDIELRKKDGADDEKKSTKSNTKNSNCPPPCCNRPDRCFLTLISVLYVAFAAFLVIACLVNL